MIPGTGWLWFASVIISVLVSGFTGWHERELREPAMLESQRTADAQLCAAAQQKTRQANDQLQKDRDDIAARLAAYSMRSTPACVSVSRKTDLSNRVSGLAGGNGAGIAANWLREYAAQAENYRRQLVTCNGFLDQERK